MSQRTSTWAVGRVLFLLFAAAGCQRAVPVVQPSPTPDLTQPLADVLASNMDRDEVRVDVEMRKPARSATIYGNGVGIWWAAGPKEHDGVRKSQQQFLLSQEQVTQVLQAFRKAGFGSMPRSFGVPNIRPGTKPQVVPSIHLSLTIAGVKKTVHQWDGGEQSKELAALAAEILRLSEEAVKKNGVGATDVADGLQKIARKELAPETLSVSIQRRIDDQGTKAAINWAMTIKGRTVRVHKQAGDQRSWIPVRLQLSHPDCEELVRFLADNGAGNLPTTLYAPNPTYLTVNVLGHGKTYSARPSADPKAGEQQKQFDRSMISSSSFIKRPYRKASPRRNWTPNPTLHVTAGAVSVCRVHRPPGRAAGRCKPVRVG
jgi:hypothetical protein